MTCTLNDWISGLSLKCPAAAYYICLKGFPLFLKKSVPKVKGEGQGKGEFEKNAGLEPYLYSYGPGMSAIKTYEGGVHTFWKIWDLRVKSYGLCTTKYGRKW